MDKKNLLSWQTFSTPPQNDVTFYKPCRYCNFLKSHNGFSLKTVNIMNFTRLLYQHSLDVAMCSWPLLLLPSRKTLPLTKKMSCFNNTTCRQSQRKHSWLKILTEQGHDFLDARVIKYFDPLILALQNWKEFILFICVAYSWISGSYLWRIHTYISGVKA